MRYSWGSELVNEDAEVYEYLSSWYASNPTRNINHVAHMLELLCTRRALEMLEQLRTSAPSASRDAVERACKIVHDHVDADDHKTGV